MNNFNFFESNGILYGNYKKFIVHKFTRTTMNPSTAEHYRSYGYRAKMFRSFTVDVRHLFGESTAMVRTICPTCGKRMTKRWGNAIKANNTLCSQCKPRKEPRESDLMLVKKAGHSLSKLGGRKYCIKCGAALSGDPKIFELCPKWRDDANLPV